MFTPSQLEAAAYRFEMTNGRTLDRVERDCIAAAGLESVDSRVLANQIRSCLDSSPQLSGGYRAAAFWALGKCYDSRLLEFFRRHLAQEVQRDMAVAYQIMVALDNLDEPVWQIGRQSFSIDETERNHEAAIRYLAECA